MLLMTGLVGLFVSAVLLAFPMARQGAFRLRAAEGAGAAGQQDVAADEGMWRAEAGRADPMDDPDRGGEEAVAMRELQGDCDPEWGQSAVPRGRRCAGNDHAGPGGRGDADLGGHDAHDGAASNGVDDGSTGSGSIARDEEGIATITGFDPRDETLEIDYVGPVIPTLKIVDRDGSTRVLLDGREVARLSGTPGLEPSHVRLLRTG